MTADEPRLDLSEQSARGKLACLHRLLGSFGSAVIAFSGGVDSAFLAFMAHQALGDQALAVTADSPSLARAELRDAVEFARQLGIRHRVIPTFELQDKAYARNSADRCYFCKKALMQALAAIRAQATDAAEILVGVNVDDLGDYRPGQQAVQEKGGRWPLVEVGLSKAEIRWLSKELGLPTWDRPAAACLSSRLAYGVPVTVAALRRIEAAEEALRDLGLTGQMRVRDQGGDLARIELDPDTFDQVLARRTQIITALRTAGFLFVTLDLEGYRQGSHNRSLPMVMLNPARDAKQPAGRGNSQ
jgi:uncharacterized protein